MCDPPKNPNRLHRHLRNARGDCDCVVMKPYYQDDYCTIYHGDCREILPQLPKVDLVLTDPPYGIEGRDGMNHDNRKSSYSGTWKDTPEYVKSICVPVIVWCIENIKTVCVTPGTHCLCYYPQPDDVGCFFTPASPRLGKFGFQSCHPIFYYGWYKNGGRNNSISGKELTEISNQNGHPCPKPLKAWTWLLSRLISEDGSILDPFMGSGTTLRAAKDLGRKAIGIEIQEKYCEIADRRLQQEVFDFKCP